MRKANKPYKTPVQYPHGYWLAGQLTQIGLNIQQIAKQQTASNDNAWRKVA